MFGFGAFSELAFSEDDSGGVTAGNWYRRLSEPVRRSGLAVAIIVASGAFYSPYFTPVAADTVTVDKWYKPLQEPPKARVSLRAGLQQATAFVKAAPFAESVSLDRWLRPLDEPSVKVRAGLRVDKQQSFIFAHAEDVTVAKWLQSLSIKPPPRPALLVGQQQHLIFVEAAPFAETISFDRWSPLYPERALGRRFPHYEQQTFAFVKASPFPESVTIDRWLQHLALPVRNFRQRSLWLYEQAARFDPFPIPAAIGDHTIVSTEVIDKPVDCVLAGQQPYEFSGRDPVIPTKYSESKSGTKRSRVKRIGGDKPSFTTKSGPLGGSHKGD